MVFTVRRVGERLTLRTTLNAGSPRFGVTAEDDSAYGVRVTEILPGRPGATATLVTRRKGTVLLESGDVITEVNGDDVGSERGFESAVAASPPVMYFALTNARDGRVHYLKTALRPSNPRFGASVTQNPGGGVRLTRVWSNSPATRAELAD
jgi:S1-C subfamily serine protease